MSRYLPRLFWSQDGWELHLCYGVVAKGQDGRTSLGYLKYDHEDKEWAYVPTFGDSPVSRKAASKTEAKEHLLELVHRKLYAATQGIEFALAEIEETKD
jgi:hypothetical protein